MALGGGDGNKNLVVCAMGLLGIFEQGDGTGGARGLGLSVMWVKGRQEKREG